MSETVEVKEKKDFRVENLEKINNLCEYKELMIKNNIKVEQLCVKGQKAFALVNEVINYYSKGLGVKQKITEKNLDTVEIANDTVISSMLNILDKKEKSEQNRPKTEEEKVELAIKKYKEIKDTDKVAAEKLLTYIKTLYPDFGKEVTIQPEHKTLWQRLFPNSYFLNWTTGNFIIL